MTTEEDNLSNDDLLHFKKYGYCILKNVFPEEVGLKCQEKLWDEMKESNYDKNDPSTWTDKKFQLSKVFYDKPFEDIIHSERLNKSIEQICGVNNVENFGAGWFTVTFPGHYTSNESWGCDGHWHIDGSFFYPYSKEIGLILFILLSNVKENDGGTCLAENSHIVGINKLIEFGMKGCTAKKLAIILREKCEKDFDVIEITGNVGDIILMHPLVLHARSKNLGGNVRFLCHPNISLRTPMDFNKPYSEMTILEQTTIDAVSYQNTSTDVSYYHNILKSITPESCEIFKTNQKLNGNKRKLYSDGDDNDNKNDEIFSTMGFFNFGKK